MSGADDVVAGLQASARRRGLAIELARWLPAGIAAVALAWLLAGAGAAVVAAGVALGWLGVRGIRHARRLDRAWIARRLDALRRDLDDSAALLHAAPETLSPLARLQRERVRQRVAAGGDLDLREPYPLRAIALGLVLAGVAIVAVSWWSARPGTTMRPAAPASARDVAPDRTRIAQATLEVAPPAYTGLAPRSGTALATDFEAGSRLAWTLELAPVPRAARLLFHDGTELPLQREGTTWRAQRTLEASTLYRLAIEGGPPLESDELQRLEAIPDRAPEVRVLEPDRTLTLLAPDQRRWTLAFEASDDHGLGDAQLRLTLAQGSGEQIAVNERTLALAGEGDARRRRYRHVVDLATLGIAAGDDVLARLQVRDNREPEPNYARSASFILRWPPEAGGEASGVEGLVQRTMPAYFRSQRQIIIDTEALIGERTRLSDEEFLGRSDGIGVDQRVLRLRYGQFLGEEDESLHAHEGHGGDAHDAPAPSGFGDAGNVLAEFGHTHDIAEAATLLDPETRKTLKAALEQMWQAELHLRQGAPREALPYEYRALDLIKRVQQADRIYLARVGLELPQVDESRRLSGDRAGVRAPGDGLEPASPADAEVLQAWAALQDGAQPDLDALTRWARVHAGRLDDGLGLVAAIDALARDPACAACREALLGQLWAALPRSAPRAALREAPDAAGRAYLDALATEPPP